MTSTTGSTSRYRGKHGTQGKSMDMRGFSGSALVVAMSAVALGVAHWIPVRNHVSLPTPFTIDPAADETTVMLDDGRSLTLSDGVLSLGDRLIRLSTPRRFASLTVMPTGQVLVWGGIDGDGRLIETGEWFEPTTRELVTTGRIGLPARAGHTLNVLTDGTLVMTGGWGEGNAPAHDVALWRPIDRRLTLTQGEAAHARFKGRAELMADGSLQITGGVDDIGRAVHEAWRFNPQGMAEAATRSQGVVDSSPGRDKTDASPIGPLALRFHEPVDVTQLGHAVSLLGPNGVVKTRVVGAEDGRLAFIQLPDELYPSARYTIFVQGLHTAKGDAVPYEAIGFTTKAARNGVVLAGEGKRPGTSDTASSEPPLFVMAGEGKVKPCKPADAFHLCRDKGSVKDGAFYPGQDNVATASGGHWRLYRDRQTLPDTRATEANLPKGDTALIGQVRRIDETPVANVAIVVDGQTVHTDARGVFVLSHLRSGRRELFVDGRPAGSKGVEYGRFVVGADVTAATVNHMPYVMYLPRVLERDKIALPSPTTRETVLTHPDMPGLELRIPAGAVFKDRDGKVLNEIAIVPTPVDHAPFPLPDNFPMYFTIQPGDAVVQGMTPEAAKGIQVVYPNYGKQKPADKADFWVYSVEKGWEMYGAGHVSQDSKQLVADSNTRLVWALGAGASTNPPKPDNKKKPNGKCAGEPVDLKTGMFIRHWTDLALNDTMPISVDRTAGDLNDPQSPFGLGMGSSLNMTLSSESNLDTPRLTLPCGESIIFDLISGQPNWPLVGTVWKHTRTRSTFFGATLQFMNDTTPEGAHWVVTRVDGKQYWFDRHAPNKLYRQVDAFGNVIQYRYNSGLVSEIVSPNGKFIELTHLANNLIGSISDASGRSITYDYSPMAGVVNGSPLLRRVNYADGSHEDYKYRFINGIETRFIETVMNRRGFVDEKNYFEAGDRSRVIRQEYANGGLMSFAYDTDSSGEVNAVVTVDPNGHKERTEFSTDNGYPVKEILAYDTPNSQVRMSETNKNGQLLSRTDVMGRIARYAYDDAGNVVSVTRLAGTPNETTIKYSWTELGRLASITDTLGHVTKLEYEGACLSKVIDPTDRKTSFTCDSQGHVASISDPVGNTTLLTYKGGDLLAITDPSGRKSSFIYDVIGRRVSTVAPDGKIETTSYDTNDRPISSTDGFGNTSLYDYDPMGNLTGVAFPNGSGISYEYDAMGNRVSYTDANGKIATFGYDLKGNLTTYKDRKHQVTTYSYNDLDLLVLRTFADGSGTSFTYGPNNRLTEALDTVSGKLSWSYDAYDRVVGEQADGSSVKYTYDEAGRRTSMTLDEENTITYQYDDANRLLTILDGGSSYGFSYDSSGRRSSLTFPNGMLASYKYAPSGELLSVGYESGSSSSLAVSTYEYDTSGKRVKAINQNGSLPGADSGDAAYDKANRTVSKSGSDYAFDDDGNMTSDGVRNYEWNARGQLVRISIGDADLLRFGYDALGRRTEKLSSVKKQYVYDGMQEVKETLNGKAFRFITGPMTDEKLARISMFSQEYFMVDGIGSTIGITDSGANILRSYSYDPYGKTDFVPGSYENSYLFTGREMDDADLYYYRSRYYLPSQGRFISEDSWGLAAGQSNFYSYVNGSPTNYVDPSGHCPWCVGAIVGGIIGGVTGGLSYGEGGWSWDWNGAAAGALAGAATGALGGPLAGLARSGAAAIGGEVAGMIGGATASSTYGGVSGVLGTMAGNYAGNKPLFKRSFYGASLGALAPLMSGEAFAAGAGSAVVGQTGGDVLGGLSGLIGGVGGKLDPLGDCAPEEYPVPQPDSHFPWSNLGW